MDCVFCKVVKGELPAYKVYEDEKTLAFLDIYPVYKGHTLVVPKVHTENISDISESDLAAVAATSKKVAELLKKKLNCDGINLVQSNGKAASQVIMHFHMHVVPRFVNDGLNLWSHGEKASFNLKEIHAEIIRGTVE